MQKLQIDFTKEGECFFHIFHYNQQRMKNFLSNSKENNFL